MASHPASLAGALERASLTRMEVDDSGTRSFDPAFVGRISPGKISLLHGYRVPVLFLPRTHRPISLALVHHAPGRDEGGLFVRGRAACLRVAPENAEISKATQTRRTNKLKPGNR